MILTNADSFAPKKLLHYALFAAAAALITLFLTENAHAAVSAVGGSDFDSLYGRLLGWTQGSLGKSLALVFLLVGLLTGLLRGSLVACVVASGCGLALVLVPSVIDSLFGSGI